MYTKHTPYYKQTVYLYLSNCYTLGNSFNVDIFKPNYIHVINDKTSKNSYINQMETENLYISKRDNANIPLLIFISLNEVLFFILFYLFFSFGSCAWFVQNAFHSTLYRLRVYLIHFQSKRNTIEISRKFNQHVRNIIRLFVS